VRGHTASLLALDTLHEPQASPVTEWRWEPSVYSGVTDSVTRSHRKRGREGVTAIKAI